ncbi:hypothetical protein HK102_001186 [Quaeritorhiza haematococci]|nr:hypothetical protein HK102_001186 [Quaeritorhiza haematococci]
MQPHLFLLVLSLLMLLSSVYGTDEDWVRDFLASHDLLNKAGLTLDLVDHSVTRYNGQVTETVFARYRNASSSSSLESDQVHRRNSVFRRTNLPKVKSRSNATTEVTSKRQRCMNVPVFKPPEPGKPEEAVHVHKASNPATVFVYKKSTPENTPTHSNPATVFALKRSTPENTPTHLVAPKTPWSPSSMTEPVNIPHSMRKDSNSQHSDDYRRDWISCLAHGVLLVYFLLLLKNFGKMEIHTTDSNWLRRSRWQQIGWTDGHLNSCFVHSDEPKQTRLISLKPIAILTIAWGFHQRDFQYPSVVFRISRTFLPRTDVKLGGINRMTHKRLRLPSTDTTKSFRTSRSAGNDVIEMYSIQRAFILYMASLLSGSLPRSRGIGRTRQHPRRRLTCTPRLLLGYLVPKEAPAQSYERVLTGASEYRWNYVGYTIPITGLFWSEFLLEYLTRGRIILHLAALTVASTPTTVTPSFSTPRPLAAITWIPRLLIGYTIEDQTDAMVSTGTALGKVGGGGVDLRWFNSATGVTAIYDGGSEASSSAQDCSHALVHEVTLANSDTAMTEGFGLDAQQREQSNTMEQEDLGARDDPDVPVRQTQVSGRVQWGGARYEAQKPRRSI